MAICGSGGGGKARRSGGSASQRTYMVNLSGSFARFFSKRWRDTFLSVLRDQAPCVPHHPLALDKAGKMNAAAFPQHAIQAFLYKIPRCSPTTASPSPICRRTGLVRPPTVGGHIFGRTCADNGITHKLTKPYHRWTNGQAERMNRTIKAAALKVFHFPDNESLKALSSPS